MSNPEAEQNADTLGGVDSTKTAAPEMAAPKMLHL